MANDLVKKDPSNALMNLESAKQYGIDLGEEDLVMPRLQLIQPTSPQEGAGKYYLTATGEIFDELDVVFFGNSRGRVMFDPDINKGIAICGSLDRVLPDPRFDPPISTNCVDCKFANRNYTEEVIIGKDKKKQFCSETMTLKGIMVDTLMPFMFTAKRTALLPVNKFLTGAFFDSRRLDKPLHCFAVRLKSEVPPKAPTKYYVPILERTGMLEREEFEAMMKKYSNYTVKPFDDDENNGGDQGLI